MPTFMVIVSLVYSIHVIVEYNLSGSKIICRQIFVKQQSCNFSFDLWKIVDGHILTLSDHPPCMTYTWLNKIYIFGFIEQSMHRTYTWLNKIYIFGFIEPILG